MNPEVCVLPCPNYWDRKPATNCLNIIATCLYEGRVVGVIADFPYESLCANRVSKCAPHLTVVQCPLPVHPYLLRSVQLTGSLRLVASFLVCSVLCKCNEYRESSCLIYPLLGGSVRVKTSSAGYNPVSV